MTPRLSVHMMVRDGAATVARALRPLKGIADEVCFVDTGSTDGTPDAIAKVCAEIGARCEGVAISPVSRPDLFFRDVASEYGDYAKDVPDLTGQYLLRDWATARNLGLDMCRGDWVLKLDADDEPMRPDGILAALEEVTRRLPHIEVLTCPYEVMRGEEIEYVTLYTRVWRNIPQIRFREVCHENVDWYRTPEASNWAPTSFELFFRDWRDAGGRVPHRNLKVLLREYVARRFSLDEATAPWNDAQSDSPARRSHLHLLTYLCDEAAQVRPAWAIEWAERMLAFPTHPTDVAWINHSKARAYAALDMAYDSEACYQRATNLGWGRACLALAAQRAKLGRERWRYDLASAIVLNQGRFYPRYASLTEIAEARALLVADPRPPRTA